MANSEDPSGPRSDDSWDDEGPGGSDERGRRNTWIGAIAGVLVVVAVAIGIGALGSDEGDGGAATETTPAQTPTTPASGTTTPGASTTPPADAGPLLKAGGVTKLVVRQGDTVAFQVRADAAEEVHVHGYDKLYDLKAGETKSISFRADLAGIFDIELERSGTPIGELTVEP